jgi:BirA family transcriptional regulator, biotin operon repressor / biotin---[acetyl-CoA-carboxylase] ligase
VTAGAQTAGRGRAGRAWVSPAGSSVLASLVLRRSGERTALLPLVAAVAVCEACERFASASCAIKWPNDVWVDGRKVAGILLEGRPAEGWAVLGIGINVATAPDELPPELRETATSLRAAAMSRERPAVEPVLAELLRALEARLDEDPATIVAAWSARDALRDRSIRWEAGEGVARGIAASGALVVESDAGTRELHAGEVSLVRPAEA